MTKPSLRAAIDRGDFVLASGIHDMIAAFNRLIGFPRVWEFEQ